MKTLWITLAAGFAVGVIALAVLATVQALERQKLADANRALQTQLHAANLRITGLQQDQSAVVRDLEARCAEIQELTAKLADATSPDSRTNVPPGAAVVPRPYQAPAYLGNQYLGLGWVVPRNVTRNPKTGRFAFEPVLVLDPSWREAFTPPATNVLVAAAPESTSYNYYNYYNPWPWIVWTPTAQTATNIPPRRPPAVQPRPSPSLPQVNSPWMPFGTALRPGSPGLPRPRSPGNNQLVDYNGARLAVPGVQSPAMRASFTQ